MAPVVTAHQLFSSVATAIVVALIAVTLSTAGAANPVGVHPGRSPSNEHQIKAAFLFNFLNYTTWPAAAFDSDDAPIVVSVVGKDPFGKILDATFRGETVGGRSVRVTRQRSIPKQPEAHLIFASKLTEKQRQELIAACANRPVLLVGETDGFAEAGGLVNFYLSKGSKVRFEINPVAVGRAKLQISSELMKLARVVKPRSTK